MQSSCVSLLNLQFSMLVLIEMTLLVASISILCLVFQQSVWYVVIVHFQIVPKLLPQRRRSVGFLYLRWFTSVFNDELLYGSCNAEFRYVLCNLFCMYRACLRIRYALHTFCNAQIILCVYMCATLFCFSVQELPYWLSDNTLYAALVV